MSNQCESCAYYDYDEEYDEYYCTVNMDEDELEKFKVYESIERLGPKAFKTIKGEDKDICANVDLYSGFVYELLNIPIELCTPLFAVSRVVGWCAHILEEHITGGRIMRPAYKSVSKRIPYTKLNDRN